LDKERRARSTIRGGRKEESLRSTRRGIFHVISMGGKGRAHSLQEENDIKALSEGGKEKKEGTGSSPAAREPSRRGERGSISLYCHGEEGGEEKRDPEISSTNSGRGRRPPLSKKRARTGRAERRKKRSRY